MHPARTFTAATEEALWQQIQADIHDQDDLFDYTAELIQAGYHVQLDIDVDFGSGFEGGTELTTLRAVVPTPLRFALHEQTWLHELGKLLGLSDVELGDTALDAAFVITTNDEAALRRLLLETPTVRDTLLRYADFRFILAPDSTHDAAETALTFSRETALLDLSQLRELYHLMLTLLQRLAPNSADDAAA
ncbi:hypothetical protein E5K00_12275 [Hymenobacter aquaticus]|uniref:Uncharacterized protein n=1 Tax=Hymenobacter aquaticus TaxID=1867101 RepID=A0A4Z0Q790_9BACT|nr:hypothetical protein [Hymenobacter aquaticus]TGE25928.1 hypothetical protein E5K00_12275 [Hymenobacter aquaticus]